MALQVLLEKCIQLFLLIWGHRVDLCTEGLCTRGKLNSMVPSLSRGKLIKGLLREDIPELLIRFRNKVFEVFDWSKFSSLFSKLLREG